MNFQELPPDTRPREKILTRGPGALSDTELLALLLRTGVAGRNVLQLAQDMLRPAAVWPICCSLHRRNKQPSRA